MSTGQDALATNAADSKTANVVDSTKNRSVSSNLKNDISEASFRVGVSEDRNSRFRRTMEDVHTYIYNYSELVDCGYFAIFDGHAGKDASRWCGSNLHDLVQKQISELSEGENLTLAFDRAFQNADEQLRDNLSQSGCTAALALLRWESTVPREAQPITKPTEKQHNRRRMLYTANVGDSRVILCRGGKAIRLSYDHKGSDAREAARIQDNGGLMVGMRVNGVLAVTRSLGDTFMKDVVTGHPYTTETQLCGEDEFLILACDGLWDVCGDQNAVSLVRDIMDPQEASKTLVKYALENFSGDNLTVMVVRLDQSVLA